jgi:hypothetical protein
MVGIVVVTHAALLIARRISTRTIDPHLGGLSPECVAVDLRSPAQLYCGTARDGLFRSRYKNDSGSPLSILEDARRLRRQRIAGCSLTISMLINYRLQAATWHDQLRLYSFQTRR